MRYRSKKTAKLYREQRIPLVKMMLDGFVYCKRCEAAQATEVHELKSRARGGSITDPDNCVPLCHECHRWITEHPKQALEDGWLKNSWD